MTSELPSDDCIIRVDRGGSPRNLWFAKIVRGPHAEYRGVWTHGGLIEKRACPSRSAALAMANDMARFYRPEIARGARVCIEPGLYSGDFMPGARFGFVFLSG